MKNRRAESPADASEIISWLKHSRRQNDQTVICGYFFAHQTFTSIKILDEKLYR